MCCVSVSKQTQCNSCHKEYSIGPTAKDKVRHFKFVAKIKNFIVFISYIAVKKD